MNIVSTVKKNSEDPLGDLTRFAQLVHDSEKRKREGELALEEGGMRKRSANITSDFVVIPRFVNIHFAC